MGFFGLFKKKKEPELPLPNGIPKINSSQSNGVNHGKANLGNINNVQQSNQQVNVPQIPSLTNSQISPQSKSTNSQSLNVQSKDAELKHPKESLQSTQSNLPQNPFQTSQNQIPITNSNQSQQQLNTDVKKLVDEIQSNEAKLQSEKTSLFPSHYIEDNTLFLELNNYKNFRSYFDFIKHSFEMLDQTVELAIENEEFENTVGDFIKNIEEMNRTILLIDKKYFYE